MRRILILLLFLPLISCSEKNKLIDVEKELEELKANTMRKDDLAKKNKDTALAFFKAIEAEDPKAIAALFAEDGKHVNPYHSGIFPKGANGKAAIEAYWTPVFPNFDGMTFPIEEIYAMEDPNMVYVKFQGDIKLKNGDGVYTNHYYSTFKFNKEGKITEFMELFNPITAAKAFGFTDQIK